MTPEEILEESKLAEAFAAKHVRELATEILEWKSTSVLREGKLRELANTCALYVGPREALSLAESLVVAAALKAISRQPTHEQS